VTGPNKVAAIPERCAIYRGSDQVMWVELRQLVESGNALADLRLRRDDVIYVPSLAEQFVSVLGEVQHPARSQSPATPPWPASLPTPAASRIRPATTPTFKLSIQHGNLARAGIQGCFESRKSREIKLKPGEIVFVPKTGFARATYVFQRLNPLFQLSSLAYLGAVL